MARRRAEILHEKLSRGDEALSVLAEFADEGDRGCQEDLIELGDKLGQKGLVASKLVAWFREMPGAPDRDDRLHGTFERRRSAKAMADAVGQHREALPGERAAERFTNQARGGLAVLIEPSGAVGLPMC